MQYVTFDDIQLVPQYSEVESRSKVDLTTRLSKSFELKIPIIAAPMDTVCESEMAIRLVKMGGVGCIHRFMSIDEQIEQTKKIEKFLYRNKEDLQPIWGDRKKPIMAAIGATGDYLERAKRLVLEGGVNVLLIDVAHGHHINVKRAIQSLIEFRTELIADNKRGFDIIAGNIATAYAAEDLCSWGADALRCGVGNGCFTPDMKVKTKNGLKKIKDIEIGDEVYTHTGELKSVYNKFEYQNYDEVYDIDGIEATANHKFYVVHQSKADLVENDEDIHRYAEWVKAEDLTDDYFLIEL